MADIEKLDRDTEITLHAYLLTFSSSDGKRVLDDLRKSYHDKAIPEERFKDTHYLIQREAERNVFLKIIRMMQRAAERVQRLEGVEPAVTPTVITEEP